jgi:hypothetical protein
MRFLRHGGIYRPDVAFVITSLGRGTASRWSAPCQAQGRDGRSTPRPSFPMSSGRLFLDRVARQQSPSPLHRHPDHKILDEWQGRNYHQTVTSVLTGCLTQGDHPNLLSRGESLEGGTRPPEETDRLCSWRDGIETAIDHPTDPTRRPGQPKVHYGAIGAANILLKNPTLRDKLKTDCGVIAIEMEGSGVADATWTAGQQYLIIRGICDYCDGKKNDVWQGYASVAAAAYTRALISSISLSSYKTACDV